MDAKYLKDTVGIPLTLCLSEVCEKRPSDPIEYIAQWLYKHVENVEAENEVSKTFVYLKWLCVVQRYSNVM